MSGPRRARDARFLLLAGAVAAALFAAFATLPVEIRRVSVTGVARMAREEVARLAGIRPGMQVGYAQARRVELALVRDPAFAAARVTRGVTGTLHIHVTERAPAAWLAERACAIAADGVVLPHFRSRDGDWPAIAGLELRRGAAADPVAVREALALAGLLVRYDGPAAGVWRRAGGGWDWEGGGHRVRFSSPPNEEEVSRLARFRQAYPDAWDEARRVDARFADRVVVSR